MRTLRCGVTVLAALVFAGGAHALPMFTLTDLGDLPGGTNQSWANGLNNLGHVTGASMAVTATAADLGWRPYVWTPASGMKRLTAPSALGIGAGGTGINDADVIVGFSGCICDPVTPYAGWTWAGNTATGAGTVTSTTGSVDVTRGINDSGQVAGWNVIGSYANPATQTAQAYRYNPGTPATATNLGHLVGGTTSSAWAINNLGHVVGAAASAIGQQPYLYTDAGGMQALTPTARGTAFGINDADEVVGQLLAANGTPNGQAFLWSAAQGLQTLGTANWRAEDINNHGWVVGCVWASGSCVNRNGSAGLLWIPGEGLHNLLDLIDPDDPLRPGLVINNAPGVNDHGQIVINARRNGIQHAYLLTPVVPQVPEPPSMVLLGLGMLALVGLRRRGAAG